MSVQHHHNHNSAATIIAIPIVSMTSFNGDVRKKAPASAQFSNGIPKHAPAISTLLQSRLYELVKPLSGAIGANFDLQGNFSLMPEAQEHETMFPMLIPIKPESRVKKQKVAAAIVTAEMKETMAYAFALQVLEWNILQSKIKA